MTRTLAAAVFLVLVAVAVVGLRRCDREPSVFEPTQSPPEGETSVVAPPEAPAVPYRTLSEGLPQKGQWRGKPALADLDGDGKLDLIASIRRWDRQTVGEGVYVWLGDGEGRWTQSVAGLHRALGYGGAEVADVDADGKLDFAFSSHDGMPHVYLNFLDQDPPSWVSTAEHGIGKDNLRGDVALGDFNRDGHVDLVTIGQFPRRGGVVLWEGDGTGDFRQTTVFLKELYFGAQVCMRDLDGDGHVELLAVAAEGPRIWGYDAKEGHTDLSEGLPKSEVGGSDLAIDAADFDGDGYCEVVVAGLGYEGHSPLRIFRREGDAWRPWGGGLPDDEALYDVSLANLDSSVVPVIVAAGQYGIRIIKMTAPGQFSSVGRIAETKGVLNVCVGDVTGDGRDEICFAGFGGVRVLEAELEPGPAPGGAQQEPK